MSNAERLFAAIDSYKDQMIEAQRTLVATPALGPENGGQGEEAKAQVVTGWLEGLGLTVERADSPDPRVNSGARPNLIARLAGGKGPARWALSHLDVVPTGDPDAWTSDPWTLRVEAIGSTDGARWTTTRACYRRFFALKAVIETGEEPAGPCGLLMVSDEETGSGHGLDHVLKVRPDMFQPADLIVVPDAGEPEGDFIEVAGEIHPLAQGGGHRQAGACLYPGQGDKRPVRLGPHDGGDPGAAQGLPGPQPPVQPARLDLRAHPQGGRGAQREHHTRPRRVLHRLPGAAGPGPGKGSGHGARQIQRHSGRDLHPGEDRARAALAGPRPAPIPRAPVVKALQKAIKQVRGVEARPGGVGGGTVAAFFRQRGLPVAVWNSWQHTAHMPDEYCLLSDLVADAKVFALLFAG